MNLIKKKMKSWVAIMTVVALGMTAAAAADGDPDAKQEVRNVAAVKLLKERKDVSLLYVKGLVCPVRTTGCSTRRPLQRRPSAQDRCKDSQALGRYCSRNVNIGLSIGDGCVDPAPPRAGSLPVSQPGP